MQNKLVSFGIFSLVLATFSAGVAFAGFEWVPPGAKKPEAAQGSDTTLTPTPAGEQVPLEPVAAQTLVAPAPPTPPAAPVAAAPVVAAAPAPVPPPAQPQILKVKTIYAPAPLSQPPSMHLPLPVAAPAAAPSSDIKWNSAPPSAPFATEAAAGDSTAEKVFAPTLPEPVVQEIYIPEPANTARPQISKRLVINPYPQKSAASAVAPDMEAPAPADESFSNVVGFGSDMPLALALQQIAPQGYIFTFGDNVNPGDSISWDGGGKPWNMVITDAIAPLGLEANIDGKVVHIKAADSGMEQQSSAVMPQAGEELSLTESKMRRDSITDPGETPKKQPLSTPVAATAETQPAAEATIEITTAKDSAADAAPVSIQTEAPQQEVRKEAEATPLLPADAAAAPVIRSVWEVRQGDSLKETLDSWSKKANVELVWNATHDYTVESDMTVNDSFQIAVQAVIAHGVKTDTPDVKFGIDGKSGKSGILIVQDKS